MPDKFDPYREALVVENTTEWPEELAADFESDPWRRIKLESLLHESPEEAAHLEYIRTHTGFCRHIVATAEDVERVSD